jgi:hypothetical protein
MCQKVSKFHFQNLEKKLLKENREHVTKDLCKISQIVYRNISNNNKHDWNIMTILILANLHPFVFEIVWNLRW